VRDRLSSGSIQYRTPDRLDSTISPNRRGRRRSKRASNPPRATDHGSAVLLSPDLRGSGRDGHCFADCRVDGDLQVVTSFHSATVGPTGHGKSHPSIEPTLWRSSIGPPASKRMTLAPVRFAVATAAQEVHGLVRTTLRTLRHDRYATSGDHDGEQEKSYSLSIPRRRLGEIHPT